MHHNIVITKKVSSNRMKIKICRMENEGYSAITLSTEQDEIKMQENVTNQITCGVFYFFIFTFDLISVPPIFAAPQAVSFYLSQRRLMLREVCRRGFQIRSSATRPLLQLFSFVGV